MSNIIQELFVYFVLFMADYISM